MSIIIVLTLTSMVMGIIIVLVDLKYNKVDLEQKEILDLLPGYNCGMCGYGSCQGMTDAMMFEPLEYKKCRPMKKRANRRNARLFKKKKKVS
jgi:Na+-translocating ferredoxin:NAD+ oxidoreductase subunit B